MWGHAPTQKFGKIITCIEALGGQYQVVELRRIVLIHDLERQGLSVSAIARQTGLDRKTVRKYLDRGLEVPVYGPRDPRPRLLEPYQGYLSKKKFAIVQSCRDVAFTERSRLLVIRAVIRHCQVV